MQTSLLGAQIYTGLLLTFAKLFKEQETRSHSLHALQIAMIVRKEQGSFLQTYQTGEKEWPDKNCHPRVQRLVKSFAQDPADVWSEQRKD